MEEQSIVAVCSPAPRATQTIQQGAGRQIAACSLQGTAPTAPLPVFPMFLIPRCRLTQPCANKSPFLPKCRLPSCAGDGSAPADSGEGRPGPSVPAAPGATHTPRPAYPSHKPELLRTAVPAFPEWIYNPSNTVHSECVTKRTDLQETICLHDDCILWHF